MDIASGLFALGGVALAGLIAEVRAWRESRSKRRDDLQTLRRTTYATALGHMEDLASRCARCVEAAQGSEPTRTDNLQKAINAFWDALTEMYRTLNEIRLITGNPDVSDAINTVLRGFRSVVETRSWTFPSMNPERKRVVTLLREDLDIA